MINKVAILRLEDICSSGIALDSELLFCKKPRGGQALQEAADQKESIRSLCRSMKPLKHKKFMQIYEATRWPIINGIKDICRWMKPLNIEEKGIIYMKLPLTEKGSSK